MNLVLRFKTRKRPQPLVETAENYPIVTDGVAIKATNTAAEPEKYFTKFS